MAKIVRWDDEMETCTGIVMSMTKDEFIEGAEKIHIERTGEKIPLFTVKYTRRGDVGLGMWELKVKL